MDDKIFWYAIGVLTTSAITGVGVIISKSFPRVGDGAARTVTGLAVGASALLIWYLHSRSVPIHADRLRLLVPYAAIAAWALIIGNIWFTVRGVRTEVGSLRNQESQLTRLASHPDELAAHVGIAPLAAKIDGLVRTTADDIGELFGSLDEHARLISELRAMIEAVPATQAIATQKEIDLIRGREPGFRGTAIINYPTIAKISVTLDRMLRELEEIKTKSGK